MNIGKKQDLRQDVLTFLKQNRVAVVSTIAPDNKPHAAAVFYTVDESFNFYFFTRSDSKKYTNLEGDNLASVVIYDEEQPRIIQAEGFASLETDEEVVKEITAELLKRSVTSSPWYDPPISKMSGGDLAVVKIHINSLRFGDFSSKGSGSKDKIFEQIIP